MGFKGFGNALPYYQKESYGMSEARRGHYVKPGLKAPEAPVMF